jgi:hypothetical protein
VAGEKKNGGGETVKEQTRRRRRETSSRVGAEEKEHTKICKERREGTEEKE